MWLKQKWDARFRGHDAILDFQIFTKGFRPSNASRKGNIGVVRFLQAFVAENQPPTPLSRGADMYRGKPEESSAFIMAAATYYLRTIGCFVIRGLDNVLK
jgi:hypothetical protein